MEDKGEIIECIYQNKGNLVITVNHIWAASKCHLARQQIQRLINVGDCQRNQRDT